MLKNKIYITILSLIINTTIFSQTREELEIERLKIIDKIEFTKGILKKTEVDKEKALEYFNALQIQIENRKKIVTNIQNQVKAINMSVELNQKSLDSINDLKQKISQSYSEFIRSNYIHNLSQNKFIYIFSAKSWDDFLDRKRYLKQYNNFAKNQLDELLKTESRTEQILGEIEKSKAELDTLVMEENENLKNLEKESKIKSDILKILNKNEKNIKKSLLAQQDQREQLNKSIEQIIFSRFGQNEKIAISTENKSVNFAGMKQKLDYPVKNGVVISKFGKHPHPSLQGVYINNKGIDLQASNNSIVNSIYDGEVVGLMFISGFNWMAIIKHGEYYSVYSKLENVLISKGDKIKKGQEIGRLGENGEFHFEIWKNKTVLDPETWLKK